MHPETGLYYIFLSSFLHCIHPILPCSISHLVVKRPIELLHLRAVKSSFETASINKQAYLGIWDLRPKEQDSGAVAFQ